MSESPPTIPSRTLPKTTCFPSSHGALVARMKNCDPLVSGPAFAILTWYMNTHNIPSHTSHRYHFDKLCLDFSRYRDSLSEKAEKWSDSDHFGSLLLHTEVSVTSKTETQTCVCSPSLLLNASVWSFHLQKLFRRCCDLDGGRIWSLSAGGK